MLITLENTISTHNKIRNYFIKQLNKKISFKDFSPNEISLLLALGNNPTINTASELCKVLMVSKGLISRSVDSLIERNLIIPIKNENDKRITYLKLNDESKTIVNSMNEAMIEINQDFIKLFDAEELKVIYKVNDKIKQFIKEKEEEINE